VTSAAEVPVTPPGRVFRIVSPTPVVLFSRR